MKKTNALRLLEQAGIPYETLSYAYEQPGMSVQLLAEQNGLSVAQIYKTLVAKGDKHGILVAVIPGSHSLVYKALARASGNRKTTLLPLKELQATTGYLRGGCSPLGMRKAFPTFFDTSALQYEQIYVNAGKRGLLMKVAPQRLGELCEASFADIAQPMS